MNIKCTITTLLLTITVLLSACNTTPAPQEPPKLTPEAQCLADGGEWRRLTRGGSPTCNQKFSDAGKACSDGAACESNTCLAPRETGAAAQCAATTSAVIHAGCTGGKMVNGKVMPLGCP